MRSDGLKPSNLALNALINAFCEDRRDVEAFAILRSMKENDLKPDVVTYTTLMKALIRVEKFDEVPAVYEEMILSGCTQDRKARAKLRSALKYMRQTEIRVPYHGKVLISSFTNHPQHPGQPTSAGWSVAQLGLKLSTMSLFTFVAYLHIPELYHQVAFVLTCKCYLLKKSKGQTRKYNKLGAADTKFTWDS